jgi:hypothetical protein
VIATRRNVSLKSGSGRALRSSNYPPDKYQVGKRAVECSDKTSGLESAVMLALSLRCTAA